MSEHANLTPTCPNPDQGKHCQHWRDGGACCGCGAKALTELRTTTLTLTATERGHVLTLLRDAQERGDYYGNRAQYWKRHARIAEKLGGQP